MTRSLPRALAAALCAVAVGLAMPALADLAANIIVVKTYTDTAVALSAADPSGSADGGTGGYSLQGEQHITTGGTVAAVWCELATEGSAITGGTLKWWKYTGTAWGYAPALDEVIPNTGEARFVSKPVRVLAPEGRVYCQTASVTETGGDGGLTRVYGFRVERR